MKGLGGTHGAKYKNMQYVPRYRTISRQEQIKDMIFIKCSLDRHIVIKLLLKNIYYKIKDSSLLDL